MARESEMIRNGGGLIDVTLCDGFLYRASIFFVCLLPFYFYFLSFFLSLLFLRTKPLVDIFIITILIFFKILLQKI